MHILLIAAESKHADGINQIIFQKILSLCQHSTLSAI